jgi:hypothetical protein
MPCPRCNQRKAKRHCPALGQDICTVCCATQRLVEIACPPDCVHLASARQHPNSSNRRQQASDVALLMSSIQQLTERQYQLFFLFQGTVARTQPDGLARLIDADVAEASRVVAKGLETAAKGVIYEEQAQGPNARKLVEGFKQLLAQAREAGARIYDREAAIALRAIEAGVADVEHKLGGTPTAYVDLMSRLLQVNRAQAAQGSGRDAALIRP